MKIFSRRHKKKPFSDRIAVVWEGMVSRFLHMSGRIKRRNVIRQLKKADIILARPRFLSLSPIALLYRILLQSQYVHSMMYIGNGQIIHTTTKSGVTVHRVPGKIYKKNRYSVYRAAGLDSGQRKQIVETALNMRGRKLDVVGLVTNIPRNIFGIKRSFREIEHNRLWCSKMIYQAYAEAGITLVGEDESEIITSQTLSQSEWLEMVR